MNVLFPIIFSATTLLMAWFAFFTYVPLVTSGDRFYSSLLCAVCFVVFFVGLLVAERFLFGAAAQVFAWIKSIIGSIGYYLFITSVVLSLASLVALLFGKNLPMIVLWLGAGVTLLFTVIGFVYARLPIVTRYKAEAHQVGLVGKKIVLVSDLHIGNLNNKNFLEKTVTSILQEKSDYVVIAGDVFDGPDVETKYFIENFKKLTSSTPVMYAPGNHEEYGPYSKFISTIKESGIVVLEDDFKKVENILFIGFKYHTKETPQLNAEISSKIAEAKQAYPNDFSLVINHAPIFISVFEKEGVDLSVHGHTHRGQFWPNNYITKIIYGDYYYGFNRRGALQVVTTKGIGLATVYNRLFNRPEIVTIELVGK